MLRTEHVHLFKAERGEHSVRVVAFVDSVSSCSRTTEEAKVFDVLLLSKERNETVTWEREYDFRDSIESGSAEKARFSLEKLEAITRGLGREEIYFKLRRSHHCV